MCTEHVERCFSITLPEIRLFYGAGVCRFQRIGVTLLVFIIPVDQANFVVSHVGRARIGNGRWTDVQHVGNAIFSEYGE